MPPSAARPQPQSALIVGAGIVGSAVAYRLAKVRLAEEEILTGMEAPLLAPFRPDRFEEETAP